jgi:predicted TIM-barrel fold metal-dependent hydrolase
MPPEKWQDINDPGSWKKSQNIHDSRSSSSQKTSPTDDFDSTSKNKDDSKKPLVKLSEGKFLPPDEGVDFNEKCKVRVKVEFLDESARSMKKVTFSLYSIFQDKTDDLCHCVDGYEEKGFAETEMTMYYPPDHQMDDKTAEYIFKAEHLRGEKVVESEHLTMPVKPEPLLYCVVDSHSHIENGACAPLPLLWDKLPLRPHFDRGTIDGLAKVIKRSTGVLQVKSTTEIGKCAVDAIDEAFGPKGTIVQSDHYKKADLFTFLVIMMMDMEYAHIAGYEGQTIYHEDESPWYYFERESGMQPENKGKKEWVLGENQKTFSKWKDQYQQTVAAIKENPFRLIGMYHYEPRRWNHSKSKVLEGNLQSGPWTYPFNEISSKTNKGLFIGFKVYPSLGYQPLDERLPFMHDTSKDGDCFYARCEQEGIPILSHCSPGGMTTHELPYYLDYDEKKPVYFSDNQQLGESSQSSRDDTAVAIDRKKFARDYFFGNYVHPRAWRKVLKKFPKLKLCLAHFGGEEFPHGIENDWVKEIADLTKEYPNVYTDVSCWDLGKSKEVFSKILADEQYAHLKDKILFGTDWYMTLVALGGKNHKKFCEEFWEFFQGIPDGMGLWTRFTFLNPFEFYGFNDKTISENLYKSLKENLKNAPAENKKCDSNYKRLQQIQQEYSKLRKKLPKSG